MYSRKRLRKTQKVENVKAEREQEGGCEKRRRKRRKMNRVPCPYPSPRAGTGRRIGAGNVIEDRGGREEKVRKKCKRKIPTLKYRRKKGHNPDNLTLQYLLVQYLVLMIQRSILCRVTWV